MKGLHLNKNKKRAVAIGISAILIAVFGLGSHKIISNIANVNATENQETGGVTGDYVFEKPTFLERQAELQGSSYVPSDKDDFPIGANNLPVNYDSRSGGYISRQENQHKEEICWAYAFTTMAESYLLRTGAVSSAIEFSPKQMDYILAPASEAFSDSTTNEYEDFLFTRLGRHRTLAGGGNQYETLVVSTGKYSLMDDDTFFRKMQLNDPELEIYNSYNQFMNFYPESYLVKQKKADVFSREDASYAVTGAEFIYPGYYSPGSMNERRQNALAKIKNNIMNYGAVSVGTHYNAEKCVYVSGLNNFTIIDRTTNSNQNACNESADNTSNHAVTLIGWDDEWTYEDNGINKTGAFIVQNSWGDTGINYYLSYSSFLQALSITDMQPANLFDDIYDISDFTKTIDANNYEITFDLTVNGTRKLSEITALVESLTEEPSLGWDIYIKSDGEAYTKIGRINDVIDQGLHSIKNLNTTLNNNLSIKIKYDKSNYEIEGLTPEIFANDIASGVTVTAYTKNESSPTPTDEPTGAITWVQGQNYTIGSNKDLIVKIDYPVDLLNEVKLDDEVVPADNYKTESGSTILTIFSDYLDTLEEGDHIINLSYNNGQIVTAQFTVEKEDAVIPADEEEVIVPNTSTSTNTNSSPTNSSSNTSSPNTGDNTVRPDTTPAVFSYGAPVVFIALVIIGSCTFRRHKRMQFDRK